MGIAKDGYEIVSDIWDRICGEPRRKKLSVSEYLKEIAELLQVVRAKFERREVPRQEAYRLAQLINDADTLAVAFKKSHRGLAEVFDQQLPRIGHLMRDADFFIDGKQRYYLHHSIDTDNAKFPDYAKLKILEACEELQRAAGTISAYAMKFEQEAKRSSRLTK